VFEDYLLFYTITTFLEMVFLFGPKPAGISLFFYVLAEFKVLFVDLDILSGYT